jgi:hypothetical protein
MSSKSGIATQEKLALPLMLSILILPLVVVAAAAGTFVGGLYHDIPSIVNTDRGSDLLTLVAVAPALAVSIYSAGMDRCVRRSSGWD